MSDLDKTLQDIAAGKLHPVYYLYGVDEYPIHEIVKALKSKVGGPMADFNLDELSGGDLSWTTVLERSKTLPMMADRRLVIAWDIDKLVKKSAPGMEEMENYVGAPLAETVLVFTAKGLDKRTKFSKALKSGGAFIYEAGHPKPHQVPGIIKRFVGNYGKQIDDAAASALAELVGTEMMWLRNEVDKLCLYVGEKESITIDDVQTVMADISQQDVWSLTDALAQRDFAKCMRLLESVSRESEAPMILGALASQIRKITKARYLLDARAGKQDVQRELGVPPFIVDKVLNQARAFRLGDLSRIYRRLEATDIRLKRSSYPPRLNLESLIADICLG